MNEHTIDIARENVAAKLRTLNPNEPSGEWSVWDLTQALDLPEDIVRPVVADLCQGSGRYVGGTSGSLYTLR